VSSTTRTRTKLNKIIKHSLFFRVIVGAPEDESEQAKVGIEKAGAVYRCQTQMPYRCDQIPFDTSGKRIECHFSLIQKTLKYLSVYKEMLKLID
jgi:hypothetical protein